MSTKFLSLVKNNSFLFSITILAAFLSISGVHFWPIQALAAIISDIINQGATILSLVIYLGILRTSESRQSLIE